MKRKIGFVLGGLISLGMLCGCGEVSNSPDPNSASGIVNGKPATDSVQKSVVALRMESDKGQALCTGSLIDGETVLTAAHCMEGNPEKVTVVFGPRVQTPVAVKAGDRFLQHPRWKKSRGDEGDLALVHFKGGLPKGFQPVRFISKNQIFQHGDSVLLIGYGVNNGLRESGAGVLRETITTVLEQFSSTQVALDGAKTSVCFGDSGGPAFIRQNGQFMQWGVASSVSDRACNEAAVHTSVGTYLKWIKKAAAQLKNARH